MGLTTRKRDNAKGVGRKHSLLIMGLITRKRDNAKGVGRKTAFCLFGARYAGLCPCTPQGATLLDLSLFAKR